MHECMRLVTFVHEWEGLGGGTTYVILFVYPCHTMSSNDCYKPTCLPLALTIRYCSCFLNIFYLFLNMFYFVNS